MILPRVVLASVSCTVAFAFGVGEAQAADCAPRDSDPVDAVRQMYAGAMNGDRAKTVSVFDREGFLFDGGARFTPEGIADVILRGEAAGTKFQWKIEEAESHAACDFAWAAWTNRGTFQTVTGSTPKTWLESAVLVWRNGSWKIRFFHSTPVTTTH